MDSDFILISISGTLAILFYATAGVLTANINMEFYLGSLIGIVLILGVMFIIKNKDSIK